MSQQQNARIFVTDGDIPIGAATIRELLMPHGSDSSTHGEGRRRYLDAVVAGVRSKSHPGDLRETGCKLVQVEDRPNAHRCAELLKENEIDEVYIVTELIRDPLAAGRAWIEACKSANIQSVLLFSVLGVEGQHTGQGQDGHDALRMYQQLEQELQRSGIQNWCILRCGFLQQSFFYFSDMIKKKRTLGMSVKPNSKWAPVNLCDVALTGAHILAYEERQKSRKTHSRQIYRLTGNQSVSAQQIVEMLNRAIGGGQGGQNIKFEELDREHMERYLRECARLDEMEIRCAVQICELIKQDKLDHVSHDIKKVTGKEPKGLEEFFRENKLLFTPQQQNRNM